MGEIRRGSWSRRGKRQGAGQCLTKNLAEGGRRETKAGGRAGLGWSRAAGEPGGWGEQLRGTAEPQDRGASTDPEDPCWGCVCSL